MKKVNSFFHNSEVTGKRERKLQVWVTDAFYDILEKLRRAEGFPSMTLFIAKILGQYVYEKQGSEKIQKDK